MAKRTGFPLVERLKWARTVGHVLENPIKIIRTPNWLISQLGLVVVVRSLARYKLQQVSRRSASVNLLVVVVAYLHVWAQPLSLFLYPDYCSPKLCVMGYCKLATDYHIPSFPQSLSLLMPLSVSFSQVLNNIKLLKKFLERWRGCLFGKQTKAEWRNNMVWLVPCVEEQLTTSLLIVR